MNARKKLNVAYLNGCLLVAGIVGIVAGSWPVFVVALAVVALVSIYTGNIRLGPRRR